LDWSHGGIVITLYNGDQGWTFDRSGVNELPATSISDFHAGRSSVTSTIFCGCASTSRAWPSASAATIQWTSSKWTGSRSRQPGTQFRLAVDRFHSPSGSQFGNHQGRGNSGSTTKTSPYITNYLVEGHRLDAATDLPRTQRPPFRSNFPRHL